VLCISFGEIGEAVESVEVEGMKSPPWEEIDCYVFVSS